jgi:deoxyribonuclease-4
MLLGAHVSIAGGVSRAFARAQAIGANAMQIFTKNANRWQAKPLAEAEVAAFHARRKAGTVRAVIAHDSYLINLAAAEGQTRDRSLTAFIDEMERCARLGIDALVMHPGAHKDAGEAIGLERIAAAFRSIFAAAPAQVTVLLENTAGQGSYLGYRFEQLAAIMEAVPQGRFGVCLDTCHAFAAGYDLSGADGYHAVMAEFDRLIGCERLLAFHLNDARSACGSRVDRHEHIGQGHIALQAFQALLRDQRFAEIPKILETAPGENNQGHLADLALLRRLAGED